MSIAKTGVCCGCGIVMQGVYSGNISIYFPCQTKDKEALQWFHRKWNSCRRRQLRDIRMRKAPLTDLMDLDIYRFRYFIRVPELAAFYNEKEVKSGLGCGF